MTVAPFITRFCFVVTVESAVKACASIVISPSASIVLLKSDETVSVISIVPVAVTALVIAEVEPESLRLLAVVTEESATKSLVVIVIFPPAFTESAIVTEPEVLEVEIVRSSVVKIFPSKTIFLPVAVRLRDFALAPLAEFAVTVKSDVEFITKSPVSAVFPIVTFPVNLFAPLKVNGFELSLLNKLNLNIFYF